MVIETFLIPLLFSSLDMAEPSPWRKIGMLLFLAMIVLGFTVPLFNLGGPSPEEQQKPAEPRLCQNDADCYLLCADKPVEVLCSQNLCQQNACGEASAYPYNSMPTTFHLAVIIQGGTIPLVPRSNVKDLFVKFTEEGIIHVFSFELPLALILQKAAIQFTPKCLVLDGKQYCEDEKNELLLKVNGKESYLFGEYVPEEGDVVEIKYEEKKL